MSIYCQKCESPMEFHGYEVSALSEAERHRYELDNMKVYTERRAQVYWCKVCKKSHTVPLER